jgi:hypothetical protein
LIDDDSGDGRGQQNLDACKYIAISQSKIRWALVTLKTYKSAAREGIFSSIPLPHIQSLLGTWVYPFGLEAS